MSKRMDQLSTKMDRDRLNLYKDKGWSGLKKQKKKFKLNKRRNNRVASSHDQTANEIAQTGNLSQLIDHISRNFNKRRKGDRSKSYVSMVNEDSNNTEEINQINERRESFVTIVEEKEENTTHKPSKHEEVEKTPIKAFHDP